MKSNLKITLSAVVSACCVVVMLVSYFPYFTYAAPAVAGLFVMVPLIEIGAGYAFVTYIVSSLIIVFSSESESAILYVVLFGFYPIVKALIEKLHKAVAEWILKLAVFNFSAILSYFAVMFIIGIPADEFAIFGKYGAAVFLVICNFAFVLYDIAISRVSVFYIVKLHSRINKYLRGNAK